MTCQEIAPGKAAILRCELLNKRVNARRSGGLRIYSFILSVYHCPPLFFPGLIFLCDFLHAPGHAAPPPYLCLRSNSRPHPPPASPFAHSILPPAGEAHALRDSR